MDNEHEPACSDCATLYIDYSIDGESEVKEELQVKLKYLDKERSQTHPDDLPIEFWVGEEEPAKTK